METACKSLTGQRTTLAKPNLFCRAAVDLSVPPYCLHKKLLLKDTIVAALEFTRNIYRLSTNPA